MVRWCSTTKWFGCDFIGIPIRNALVQLPCVMSQCGVTIKEYSTFRQTMNKLGTIFAARRTSYDSNALRTLTLIKEYVPDTATKSE